MPDEKLAYFDDSYSSGVTLVDGKPVKYWSRADPPTRDEDLRDLADRIQELTGHRVRFGAWERLFEFNPLDACSEVPLVVID